MREGKPSKRFANKGVYNICLGPNAPILQGERLKLCIYDSDDNVVRRLEEIRGECLDPGYVDFFLGPNCSPAKYQHYLVDIAPDGTQTIVHDNPQYFATRPEAWYAFVGEWADRYGVPQKES